MISLNIAFAGFVAIVFSGLLTAEATGPRSPLMLIASICWYAGIAGLSLGLFGWAWT